MPPPDPLAPQPRSKFNPLKMKGLVLLSGLLVIVIATAGYYLPRHKIITANRTQCQVEGRYVYNHGKIRPGEIVYGADKATYVALDDYYAKDKNTVYLANHPFADADLASFETLGGGYAKDKENIFANDLILKNVDRATFKVLSDNFAQDKNNFYYVSLAIPILKNKSTPSDVKVFKEYYVQVGNQLYYGGQLTDTHPDFATLQELSPIYAIDKDHVYDHGEIIPGANPKNFHVIDDSSYMSTDGSTVFAGSIPVPDLDASTTVAFGIYAKDTDTVYAFNDPAQDIDPASLHLLGGANSLYGVDKNYVWYGDTPLKSLDPNSAVVSANGEYIHDNKAWYHYDRLIAEADPTVPYYTFPNSVYSMSKQTAYYNDELLNADCASFELLGYFFAKDKDHVFYQGVAIPGVHADSFHVLGDSDYGIDNFTQKVYFGGKEVLGANGTSFRLASNEQSDATDGVKNYIQGEVVEEKAEN